MRSRKPPSSGGRYAQYRHHVAPGMSGIEVWPLQEAVGFRQHFQEQGVFVRPMFVDGRFTDAGFCGDRIHARGIVPRSATNSRTARKTFYAHSRFATSPTSDLDLRKEMRTHQQ